MYLAGEKVTPLSKALPDPFNGGRRMNLDCPLSMFTGMCPAGSGASGQRSHPHSDRMLAGASTVRDPGGL